MIKIIDKKDCCGCGLCASICPKHCIEMIEDEEGFVYPKVNKDLCVNCDLCNKKCPIQSYSSENQKMSTCALAYSKNDETRKTSSSGGIFSEIALYILKQSGIVYGASLEEELKVKHIRIDNVEQLEKLKGSKYVQSEMNGVYIDVKKDLEYGKNVLFTGTPCEIAALNSFLKKDYNNLYTCDLICHGVPSYKILKKYLNELEEKQKSNVQKVFFRNKDDGWANFRMKIFFENGHIYSCQANKDSYMKFFLKNASLRPSCYECKFSKIPRCADLTLGDYWGVEKVHPELKDDKGVSMIVINNDKGEELLSNINNSIVLKKGEDLNDFIKFNPCLCKSVSPNPNREKFFNDLDKYTMKELEKKYFREKITVKYFLKRIKNFMVRFIKNRRKQ